MPPNFAVVEALNQFLRGTDMPSEAAVETLVNALSRAGDDGIPLKDFMRQTKLVGGDLLRGVSGAINAGLIEMSGSGDEATVKLTEQGRTLYSRG